LQTPCVASSFERFTLAQTAFLDTHLQNEKHSKRSALLADAVIGMSDGLTVPFALAAGLSGAVDSSSIIITAGIAAIAAGSIAMGFGGYFAGKAEMDPHHEEKSGEYSEAGQLRQKDLDETKAFFAGIGLSESQQEQAAQEVAKDKNKWAAMMMNHEVGLQTDPGRAQKSALNIGISYAIGGLVPLSPYFFTGSPFIALKYSCVITLLFLFVFGWLRGRLTGASPFWAGVRAMVIGAMAAGAAFGVARIFESAG